jgi:hypothetical protein
VLSVSFVGITRAAGSWTGDGFAGAVFGVAFAAVFATFAGCAGVPSKASENLLFSPGSALMRADALLTSTMASRRLLHVMVTQQRGGSTLDQDKSVQERFRWFLRFRYSLWRLLQWSATIVDMETFDVCRVAEVAGLCPKICGSVSGVTA